MILVHPQKIFLFCTVLQFILSSRTFSVFSKIMFWRFSIPIWYVLSGFLHSPLRITIRFLISHLKGKVHRRKFPQYIQWTNSLRIGRVGTSGDRRRGISSPGFQLLLFVCWFPTATIQISLSTSARSAVPWVLPMGAFAVWVINLVTPGTVPTNSGPPRTTGSHCFYLQ